MEETLLEVRDLKACYFAPQGTVWAVDGLSFDLRRGETLSLVGESGCGKTATGLALLRLIESLHGRVVGGQVLYHDQDLVKLPLEELRRVRGARIAMIFQDPATALNPVLKIGEQIGEVLRLHLGMGQKEARDRAIELLRQVGIPGAERRVEEYPHQFSGGMKQRVLIATALACNPEVLIADEPTTALDVTTKAQILEIFRQLRQNRQMSMIFITHDLGVVAEMADRVLVMYGGRLAEAGSLLDIFDTPQHPYTQALMKCLPDISQDRLQPIPGTIPSLINPPDNCLFSPRCPFVMKVCTEKRPPEYLTAPDHRVACYLHSRFPVFTWASRVGAHG